MCEMKACTQQVGNVRGAVSMVQPGSKLWLLEKSPSRQSSHTNSRRCIRQSNLTGKRKPSRGVYQVPAERLAHAWHVGGHRDSGKANAGQTGAETRGPGARDSCWQEPGCHDQRASLACRQLPCLCFRVAYLPVCLHRRHGISSGSANWVRDQESSVVQPPPHACWKAGRRAAQGRRSVRGRTRSRGTSSGLQCKNEFGAFSSEL